MVFTPTSLETRWLLRYMPRQAAWAIAQVLPQLWKQRVRGFHLVFELHLSLSD